MRVPVYIFAGGHSRRFGSDKARAEFAGVPQVVHLSRLAAQVASSVTVVASTEGVYQDLGLRTIADIQPRLGPIGGLLTAIDDAGADWLLVMACDWVGLEADWLSNLIDKIPEATDIICCETRRWTDV